MKKSIAFLPKENREGLKYIVSLIREKIPQCEMIILFGSYARGEFVRYDERVEFGIPTSFMSDYDILVVHSARNTDIVSSRLHSVWHNYWKCGDRRYQVPLQLIHDTIKKVNKDLEDGRYFYTDLKKDGIMLYDSGNYKLARRRKLNFEEIKEQAEEYFEDKFNYALDFIRSAKYDYKDEKYRMCAFHLHQACENFFVTILLVYTLRSGKEHNLQKLFEATRGYAPELYTLFPLEDEEEKRLFEILIKAYVEARYNPKFTVSKEDIEALTAKVEELGKVTEMACQRRIAEYKVKGKN